MLFRSKQSGINLIRMWGGGIAESDYFFQLCDEMGLLVWQEFWMTGDTKHPQDKDLPEQRRGNRKTPAQPSFTGLLCFV